MDRLISLAAGCIRELQPPDFVSACAQAGWPAAGIWFDSENWTEQMAEEVRLRLDDTGLVPLDMEAVFVTPGDDDGDRMVNAAAEVGARHLLVVGMGVDVPQFADRFGQLCDRAAPAGITCVVEFTPILAIANLGDALEVLTLADRQNAGLLVDNLHLARSGSSPDDLRDIDVGLMPYVQLCDAPAEPAEDLYNDALNGRRLPGEGELPIAEFVAALPPRAAVSAEILSRGLRECVTDPAERARVILEATVKALNTEPAT